MCPVERKTFVSLVLKTIVHFEMGSSISKSDLELRSQYLTCSSRYNEVIQHLVRENETCRNELASQTIKHEQTIRSIQKDNDSKIKDLNEEIHVLRDLVKTHEALRIHLMDEIREYEEKCVRLQDIIDVHEKHRQA